MQAVTLKDDPVMGPTRFVDGQRDVAVVQNFLRRAAAEPQLAERLVFTTGLGVRSGEVPLRLPALLAPVLRTLERLRELGLASPRYVVYQATDFIADTNAVDGEVAQAAACRMQEYLQRYVERVHPHLVDAVRFRFGADVPDDLATVLELCQEVRAAVTDQLVPQEVIEQLIAYRKHNAAEAGSEYVYAAANVLYNGARPERYPFADELPAGAELLVPIGGRKELPFFQLSRALQPDGTQPRLAPLIVRSGELPTYYPHRGPSGDITAVDDATDDRIAQLHPHVRRDFEVLAADGASVTLLRDLYPNPPT